MKKRILALLLTVMMVMSVIVMPTSAATIPETPKYSWDGFVEGDMRAYFDDQVADLGFKGPIASAPELDGEISDDEYTVVQKIPFLYNSDTSGKYKPETEVTDYYINANFAVHGDYLYVAVDQTDGPALGANNPAERIKVQFDIGVAANSSPEAVWNRITMGISADGTLSTTTGMMSHDTGATKYADTLAGVYSADYIVEHTFDWGVYELKIDLGQLYRLFANLPGGQQAWDTPCVSFAMWFYTGRTNAEGADHYCYNVNFKNANGRGGNWVPSTVLIPETTLDALEAKYKGVIGPLGEDVRNAVEGQLIRIEDYATTAPTVDGKVNGSEYTTSGTYKTLAGDIDAKFSVKDGYLYGAFTYDGKPVGANGDVTADFDGDGVKETKKIPTTLLHFGTFAAVNSSSMLHSRCQTTLYAHYYTHYVDGQQKTVDNYGDWSGSQAGMWKTAQGPADSKWHNKELNSGTAAANAWKAMQGLYDESSDTFTVEFQISIPSLLAVLEFEGFNPDEANAVQFMFWPDASGNTAYMSVPSDVATNIYRKTGYGYGLGNVLPTVELPKGCAEAYRVSDVDDMGTFGQRIVDTKQSVATIDGTIGAGEYTSSIHYNSEELVDYNTNKPFTYDISQTDYFSYDKDYFYYGAKIYDPYYKEGSSMLQMNLSVLNKHDSYVVTNTHGTTTIKIIRENYIDIADVITRASWDNVLYNDKVGTSATSKPGCVIRSQTLTSGTLAADVQAAFKARANTFGDAGYEFDGSYDASSKTYTFEAKIPLDELKNLFQLDEQYDIESINIYTLYKFTTPDTAKTDYAMTSQLRTEKMQAAWEALRTLTQASKGSTGTPYNQNCVPNVVKFVDEAFTKDTASVRLSNEFSGLRFKSVYTDDYLAYMAKYAAVNGKTMEVGTLIAPKDYVDAAGAFTHAALGAGNYIEVKANTAKPFANENGVTVIAGSIVNIKTANLNREFAGIGYIKIGNEYFYTDTYTVKSVSSVASAALADTSTTKGNGYNYEVSTGVYSPYSEGHRTILNNLIAK